MEAVVRAVMAAAKAKNVWANERMRDAGLDPHGANTVTARTALGLEPNPADLALRAYMKALPEEVVYRLGVLMYSGRDGEAYDDLYKSLRRIFPTKDSVIDQVTEKIRFANDIKKGFDAAQDADVNLDAGLANSKP